MKILAVYLFRSDGIPLISRFYDKNAKTVDALVAPFLVSTINRMEEITGSNMQEIRMQEHLFLFMEQFAEVIAAVVTNERGDTSLQLDLVARRFYKRFYSDLTGRGWKGQVDKLEAFFPEMERLLGIESDTAIKQMPSNVLDSFLLTEFDTDGQTVIKELIKNEELSEKEISDLVGAEKAGRIMAVLEDDGYVGVKQDKDGTLIYFT